MLRPNRIREKLTAGEPTVGTHVLSIWPGLVELIGNIGSYDYIEFLGEYGPYDLFSMDAFGRAIAIYDGLGAMMKVDQEPRTYLAQRAIGAGFQSILFTDCRTVDDVRECVRAVRPETPEDGGINGVAMRRVIGYVGGSSPDWVQYLRDIVVALMIEKEPAVRNIEQLLEVPGVDMVQFGPGDFSLSIGHVGERDHPRVVAARKHVVETALAMDIAPRAEILTADQAKPYLDMGVRHFCIGYDVSILDRQWRTNADEIRDVLDIT